MLTSEPRFPARFAPAGFEEDVAGSNDAGATVAQAARREYERDGIPRSHLKPCDAEGRDGTNLAECVKSYLPQPDGKWGMVFKAQIVDGLPRMDFLAFGMRHHPRESHARTVYEIAHRRLNAVEEQPASARPRKHRQRPRR